MVRFGAKKVEFSPPFLFTAIHFYFFSPINYPVISDFPPARSREKKFYYTRTLLRALYQHINAFHPINHTFIQDLITFAINPITFGGP